MKSPITPQEEKFVEQVRQLHALIAERKASVLAGRRLNDLLSIERSNQQRLGEAIAKANFAVYIGMGLGQPWTMKDEDDREGFMDEMARQRPYPDFHTPEKH